MKIRYLILLALGLVGCASPAPPPAGLTAAQAGSLAQELANEKANTLFHCQPFLSSQPAQFVKGHWVWHDLRGQGKGDLEATVKFAADGANPDVNVTRLDNQDLLRAGGFR